MNDSLQNRHRPGDNILLDLWYEYDSGGNIEQKITEHGTYSYGYDSASRLISAENPTLENESYTYDALGNRTSASNAVGEIAHNANNELERYGEIEYAYDNNGNLIQKRAGEVAVNYLYNAKNQLVNVEDNLTGLVIAGYAYDPFGRRLWKEVDGVRTYFFYSDEGLIAEYDETGTEIRSYGYKPDSTWTTDPLWLKEGGAYYWYQNDHLGTPQKIVDSNGTVVWSAQYAAFGEANVSVETVTNNLRFPGQYEDAETGLHYNFQRYYDPGIGRYMQTDPIEFASGDVNWYGYGGSNPINYQDALGLMIQCRCIDEYLNENGVTGWKKTGEYSYTAGPGFGYNTANLTSEILGTMIESVRTFTIEDLEQEWLVQHVNAREEIVASAQQFTLERVDFSVDKLNPQFWYNDGSGMVRDLNVYAAVQDILNQSSSVYSMGCRSAGIAVMLSGIARAMGEEKFNQNMSLRPFDDFKYVLKEMDVLSETDWVPGDAGYIENVVLFLKEDPLNQYVGQNIIYIGNNLWWGHGPASNQMSLEGWKNFVSSWDLQPAVFVERKRTFPKWGLE